MTYKNWLNEWLTHYIKPSSKQRTFEQYSKVAQIHIFPYLGDVELIDLTPFVLQKFITDLTTNGNKRTGKGLSPNFVKTILPVIQKSFESYFNIETSYTSLNGMLQVNYKVYPQNKEIIKNEESSDRIMLTVTVSFYKGYNASGFFLDSENIQIILQKSKGYSVNGVKSISVPTKAQSYKLYVSKAIGSICE